MSVSDILIDGAMQYLSHLVDPYGTPCLIALFQLETTKFLLHLQISP